MDQQLQSFEGKVQTLDDKDLVEQVRQLFHREKRLGDAILLGLKEIKQRRLFAALGYSSLFEMLVKHYHLSETASYQRVNALKLIESVPEAQEVLFSGEVSLSNAALVQSFIQRSEKETKSSMSIEEKMHIIESIKGKTHREAQITLAESNPIAALPANKEKALSKIHTQLQIVVDEETIALLKEIQSLLSHTIPDGEYNAVLKYMGKQVVEFLRKKKGRSASASKLNNNSDSDSDSDSDDVSSNTGCDSNLTQKLKSDSNSNSSFDLNLKKNHSFDFNEKSIFTSTSIANSASRVNSNINAESFQTTDASKHCVRTRYISRETKRKVYARSKGQCEFVAGDGHRCESRHQLEFDHVTPWSQGGTNAENNIQILCKIHNLYRVKETHGFW
ncbi:MAG: HNH endonuclease, partial [Bdellovibrio sp.]